MSPAGVARRVSRTAVFVGAILAATATVAVAQVPMAQSDPAAPNLFYGATLPGSANRPILVFVHGLHGTASDWWGLNDMYKLAYLARYRTAFVSLNADNTPNDAGLDDNAAMLRTLFPLIAQHFNGEQFYVVGHSKGGVDTQAALLYPEIRPLVKGVFTISAPNQGTELADWAFGPGRDIAGRFNLLTPGVFAMQTARMAAFRAIADPVLQAAGVPFYTMTGDSFLGNIVTDTTGLILRQLAPAQRNDGFVTVERSKLPATYSADLDTFHENHFLTDNGIVSFSRIQAVIEGLETTLAEFRRVAVNGINDPHNTWIWSMKWYKGALYVGTGREAHCVSLATAQAVGGFKAYELGVLTGECPGDFAQFIRSLAAEIWRYQPATGQWTRVFKSPAIIPMGQDADGNPIMLARDIGFRGMEIFTEADGTDALYVGGVSAGSAFGAFPPYSTIGFPPPRVLRTTDGSNWAPIPQAPGTFLGEIAQPRPGSTRKQWSFRALTSYRGKLFATVADYRGVGMIVASANPSAGNNAWFPVSPIPEEFPVWNLTVYNDFLYATTGDQVLDNNAGTGLYKTDASGTPPYQFRPVITNGGFQPDPRLRSSAGLSFMEFKGQLFLGTNRPTELYRINPDDTWDLIVGEPRMTPQGLKTPLSGLGIGFGSWFIGHFWRMGTTGDQLFLGTWDWSVQLRGFTAFDHVFDEQYGFDLFRTSDGIHWSAVSRNGMGDPGNYGGRSFENTPYGLFFGTARTTGGGQIYQCLTPDCQPAASAIEPPALVQAASEFVAGRTAVISWEPVPGAVKYHVYRAVVQPITYFLNGGANLSLQIPGTDQVITLDTINSGQFDPLCAAATSSTLCEGVNVVRDASAVNSAASFPLPWAEVAVTENVMYSEPAPSAKQSLYYVIAEDVEGNVSRPSNFVGAPSKAFPSSPPKITAHLTPEPNAAGWNNTPVTVSWTVEPADFDIITSAACAPVTLTADTAGTLLTCEALTGSGARSVKAVRVKIDSVAPQIAGSRSPQSNAAGWINTDVTVTFTCQDDLSGIFGCGPAEQVVATEGAGQYRGAVAIDLAGNKATAVVGGINIDKTAPIIAGSRTPQANAAGWNNTDVVVQFGCIDNLSGVGACGPTPQIVSGEGVNQSRLGSATDLAGNIATSFVNGINIDKTPPVLVATPSPAANAAGWNNTGVTVTFTANDPLSGLGGVTPPITVAGEGAGQVVSGTAVDRAGNAASLSATLNIDLTAPEAMVRFDPGSLTTIVIGTDTLSGLSADPIQPTQVASRERRRSYLVADRAGNTLQAVLGFESGEHGRESHARVQTLQYNGGPIQMVVPNSLKFEASVAKGAGLKELEQQLEVQAPRARKQELTGKFDSRKNQTRITLERTRRGEPDRLVLPGLVLLKLTTRNGELVINY